MLRLNEVSKTYPGDVVALRDVSLEIPNGLFGLLGPNGAGKSTLMRTIATLQEPDTGTITFGEIDVLRDKQALRRVLGYLSQEFGAYPRTSVQAMLEHFAALKGFHGKTGRQMVEALLVKTNLWEERDRSVDKFSGGMKQRYGIAQALIGDPKLIIVDEPTAGLDPAERRRFQNLLAEIGEEVVVILSTHIVDDVEDSCSRVAIMGGGKILKEGYTTDLIHELRGKVWCTSVARSRLDELDASHAILSTRLKGGSMEIRVYADAEPNDMVPAAPNMEDVYFHTLNAHGVETDED